jgi:hypothetical protein
VDLPRHGHPSTGDQASNARAPHGSVAFEVSGLQFSAASESERASGLLGWATFEVGPIRIYRVAVRRTVSGVAVLSFPTRKDRSGRSHPIVHSVASHASAVQAKVLAALGIKAEERAP